MILEHKNNKLMDRRTFLQGLGAMGLASVFPVSIQCENFDFDSIQFDKSLFEKNNAQTIVFYLYGGASELGGNLTNITEINDASQNSYPLDNESYFRMTNNHFWGNSGGDAMQRMFEKNDMNIFRTCFRTIDDLKSHGECTSQAQRGKDLNGGAGLVANLAAILYKNGAIDEPSIDDDIGKNIPFVTMEGESAFFVENGINLKSFLKPVAFDADASNPYSRKGIFHERLLKKEENLTIGNRFDQISKKYNKSKKIKEAFDRRVLLMEYVDQINAIELPEGIEYPENNIFADRLKKAMTLLIHNPHTKLASIGGSELGLWDDHSNALYSYPGRMTMLMEAIEAAVEHMKIENRNNINIVVFGEFGRNVNYNNSFGWDHGNNQNVYWFGGSNYLNQLGIVGETELTGSDTRLYLQPKNFGEEGESYHFQTFSIAATLYKMYGVLNPEILTNGNLPIEGLLKEEA